MNKLICIGTLLAFASPLQAAYVDFSFCDDSGSQLFYGNNVEQTYDVAIRLDDPMLIGTQVKSVSVVLPTSGICNVSVWMSSELKLKKVNGRGVNDPDICSIPVSITDDRLDVVFNAPYTIPADGCYIGYSFTVESLDESSSQPVCVVDNPDESGFFLHTSRTKTQWGSMSESTGFSSAMTVGLEGDFQTRSASIDYKPIETFPGEPAETEISLINTGIDSIETVELTCEGKGFSITKTVSMENPVRFLHRVSNPVILELPPVDDPGAYPLTCKVDKINGIEVNAVPCVGLLTVYPFKPEARPLIDEYTGLWCGYCPKGYVVLEEMKKKHGDRFIACAYHYNDPMAFNGTTPNQVHNYPAAFVNRNSKIEIEEIPERWETLCDFIPDADVDVSVAWTHASQNAIDVCSTLRFIKDSKDAGYRMSYVLVADNLSDAKWRQHNSYSGGDVEAYPYMDSEIGHIFLQGGEYVEGLVFNDVALAASDVNDPSSLLPSDMVAGETYTHSYVFNLEGIDSTLLTHPEQLRVVGILTRGKTKTFVNCNSSLWINGDPFAPSGMWQSSLKADRCEIGRYSIDGTRLRRTVRGLQIIRYSDGSTCKVYVK